MESVPQEKPKIPPIPDINVPMAPSVPKGQVSAMLERSRRQGSELSGEGDPVRQLVKHTSVLLIRDQEITHYLEVFYIKET